MSSGPVGKITKAKAISICLAFITAVFLLYHLVYFGGKFDSWFNWSLFSNFMFYLTLDASWERVFLDFMLATQDTYGLVKFSLSLYSLLLGIFIGVFAGIYIALKLYNKKDDQKINKQMFKNMSI
ncbi:MAG: hypothetical protein ACETWM_16735 [Candidatus Lokiarchaeia archaeon]